MGNHVEVVNRYNKEIMNGGNLEKIDELLAEDYEHGSPPPGMSPDREGFKNFVGMVHKGLPDYELTVQDTITEGNKVVQKWTATGTHNGEFMDVPASGNEVNIEGISIYEVRDGKIVKDSTIADMMKMMQQIGAMPSPD